jgi:hypothetical protein
MFLQRVCSQAAIFKVGKAFIYVKEGLAIYMSLKEVCTRAASGEAGRADIKTANGIAIIIRAEASVICMYSICGMPEEFPFTF